VENPFRAGAAAESERRVERCGLASQAPLCQVKGQLATKTPTAASPDTIRFLTTHPPLGSIHLQRTLPVDKHHGARSC